MVNDFIVTFSNGGVIDIELGDTYIPGNCPTCDIGSERVNFIKITTTKFIIRIMACNEHCYVFGDNRRYDNSCILTSNDIINIFNIKNSENMTEEDFVGVIISKTAERVASGAFDIRIKTINLDRYTGYDFTDVDNYVE